MQQISVSTKLGVGNLTLFSFNAVSNDQCFVLITDVPSLRAHINLVGITREAGRESNAQMPTIHPNTATTTRLVHCMACKCRSDSSG